MCACAHTYGCKCTRSLSLTSECSAEQDEEARREELRRNSGEPAHSACSVVRGSVLALALTSKVVEIRPGGDVEMKGNEGGEREGSERVPPADSDQRSLSPGCLPWGMPGSGWSTVGDRDNLPLPLLPENSLNGIVAVHMPSAVEVKPYSRTD